jgi:mercuric ion transport protein
MVSRRAPAFVIKSIGRGLDPVAATGCILIGMTIKRRKASEMDMHREQWLALGGLLGALTASSCCILPVVLFSLGISGAWIGNFTQLAPYKLFFIIAAAAFLGAGYWKVYRSARTACVGGKACARPLPNRIVKGTLVVATMLVIAAFGFDYVAPYLLA